jgi:hypothetical protein
MVLPAAFTKRALIINVTYRGADQITDFLGSTATTLSQTAHFRRHHGKAAALLARTGRFHCRIQRQNIGLECDAFDYLGNLAYLARGLGDLSIMATAFDTVCSPLLATLKADKASSSAIWALDRLCATA